MAVLAVHRLQKTRADLRLFLADHLFQSVIRTGARKLWLPRTIDKRIRRTIVLGEAYEAPETELIQRFLRPGMDVIELGGSLGIVAARIGDLLGPGDRHIVVEAIPEIAAVCRRNAAQPGHRRELVVIDGAISYATTDSVVFRAGHNAHTGRLARPDEAGLRVPATTLSAVMGGLSGDRPVAVVCDIEGAEYDLFDHDSEALRRAVVVIMEFHAADPHRPDSVDMERFIETLPQRGFRTLARIGDVLALGPDR